jgi:membrane protein
MGEKISRIRKWHRAVRALLDPSSLRQEKPPRLHRFVHFWILVWQSFTGNRCPVHASGLAYATLLSLIPMLAVVVSITSTFLKKEGEEQIDQFIAKAVANVTSAVAVHGSEGSESASGPAAGSSTNRAEVAPQHAALETGTNGLGASTNGEAGTHFATAGAATNLTSTTTTNAVAAASSAKNDEAIKARKDMARYIHGFIQNTRSGALGVTGSILLIFAGISLLVRIEDTFNDIWGVARGRSWFMRIVLYWGVLSLMPLLLVLAAGLATGPHLESSKRLLEHMPFIGNFLIRFVFQLLPVVILCLTFALLYMLVPNTRVHWCAALVGGFIGGLLFHLNNVVSVLYVSRVVSNSKIYGSLGLVPVFMIGLYFSWLILLFGAQVAYAYQNRSTYLEEKQVESVNQRGREFVALRLMTAISQPFDRGEAPPSLADISEHLSVPSRLVRQILETLIAARLVVETAGTETAFLPARPLNTITCHDVLQAMRASQGQEFATRDEPVRAEVLGEFQRIEDAERLAASSVTMLALVQRGAKQIAE